MSKLKIKDLVSIAMFTALYFIFVLLGVILSMLLKRSFNMAYAPMCTALISGIVYLLMVQKVAKFGAITMVATVLGIFFFLSGHFALSLIPAVCFGLLADLIASKYQYKNKWMNRISYAVFSFCTIGPVAMMWFAKDAYVARLMAKGKDSAYIQQILVEFNTKNVMVYVLGIIICAFIGMVFAERVSHKYFERSGLI